MMSERVRVPPVDDPDFIADVRHPSANASRRSSELHLVGSADVAAAAALGALLETLDTELAERDATELVVDMRALDYMSAPCVKQLVLWISRLADRPESERFHVVIRTNPTIAWQRHSLRALACFDTAIQLDPPVLTSEPER